jgi:hypothetical protein
MKNQIPYQKKQAKEFREFRLIEIQNEMEVKEIASFVYPFWKGGNLEQYIYFSDNGDYMFERLFFKRFLIYKKVPQGGKNSSRVKWELVKRISNLPT